MVFHCSCHMERWVSHCVNTNFDMSLFNVHDCIFDCFCHLHFLHQHRQASSSECTHIDFLTGSQSLSSINYAQLVELVSNLLCLGNPVVILRAESLEFGDKFGNLADKLVILNVVFSVLHVVAT